jgi:CheY-like chemotaxis protein
VYAINPREIKYDPRTISDAARIFYAAGENWTMASAGWDMTNFGLFSGDDDLGATMVRRLYEKVIGLRGKKLVISECGHGYRATRCEGPNWAGMDVPFPIESSIQTTLRYLREGRLRVDRTRNPIPVTYHDPCDSARSCGLLEEPRELLHLVAADFREMVPNRAENFCCGGGGGAMSMSEYTPLRLKSGLIKANQLKATKAKMVATSCHNCVDALTDVVRHYKLEMQVTQIVNLVSRAVIMPRKGVVREEVLRSSEILNLKGYKILVAEDEPDISLFISTVLEDNGAKVLQAYDGDQAIELARLEKPDLITLDLSMPGRNGAYVYEQLKQTPELSFVRVCIITGNPELRRLIYDRPVSVPEGYLDKPINEEVLLRNIRKILELPHISTPVAKLSH